MKIKSKKLLQYFRHTNVILTIFFGFCVFLPTAHSTDPSSPEPGEDGIALFPNENYVPVLYIKNSEEVLKAIKSSKLFQLSNDDNPNNLYCGLDSGPNFDKANEVLCLTFVSRFGTGTLNSLAQARLDFEIGHLMVTCGRKITDPRQANIATISELNQIFKGVLSIEYTKNPISSDVWSRVKNNYRRLKKKLQFNWCQPLSKLSDESGASASKGGALNRSNRPAAIPQRTSKRSVQIK